MTLLLVVFSILLFGLGYGLLIKSKERLKMHRWSMTMGAILTSGQFYLLCSNSLQLFYRSKFRVCIISFNIHSFTRYDRSSSNHLRANLCIWRFTPKKPKLDALGRHFLVGKPCVWHTAVFRDDGLPAFLVKHWFIFCGILGFLLK